MFQPSPLRRTYAAALRDLTSAKPAVRASAAADLLAVGTDTPRAAADALAPLLDDRDAAARTASAFLKVTMPERLMSKSRSIAARAKASSSEKQWITPPTACAPVSRRRSAVSASASRVCTTSGFFTRKASATKARKARCCSSIVECL